MNAHVRRPGRDRQVPRDRAKCPDSKVTAPCAKPSLPCVKVQCPSTTLTHTSERYVAVLTRCAGEGPSPPPLRSYRTYRRVCPTARTTSRVSPARVFSPQVQLHFEDAEVSPRLALPFDADAEGSGHIPPQPPLRPPFPWPFRFV